MKLPTTIFATLFAGSAIAIGQESPLPADLPLASETVIQVKSYGAQTGTFCIFSVRFPGEGDSFATKRALLDAVSSLDVDEVDKNPRGLVGKRFKTEKELLTVTYEAVATDHPDCTPG